MITCRDVANLQLDGTELLTGEVGLERVVSWTYMVQTKPYADHMNPGNFALIVVDYLRFDMKDAFDAMIELNELGISGLAISVVDDKEMIPDAMIQKALALKLPLFYIRWQGATFVDIAQNIGELIFETGVSNKSTGDYLYNLLFGYEVNDKYIEKINSLNAQIPQEEITNGLYQTCDLIKQIETSRDEKDNPKLKKLYDYYLPILVGILEKYKKLQDVSIKSDEFKDCESQLIKTIILINEALKTIYEEMHEDDYMNINADLETLQTLLKKDGLTEDPFKK